MSAPSLVNTLAMPTVVSRLPKFSSRPKPAPGSDGAQLGPPAGTSTRLTNGFYHHPGPAANSSLPAAVKQNGFIRVPTSLSVKWKKESGTMEDGEWKRGKGGNVGQNRSSSSTPQDNSQQQQGSPVVSQRDAKKPTTSSAGKGRCAVPATPSFSPSPQSSPRTQSQAGQTKQILNGFSGPKTRSRTSGSLRQPQGFVFSGGSRPGSGSGFRSGSPLQKKPPASRSQSTDSLGASASVQLTESDRFRSRSLTQVRQQASPTLTPSSSSRAVTRSYSSSTPPRGSLTRSPAGSRTPEAGGQGGGLKVQSSGASGSFGGNLPSLLPPSALKKPLLSSLSHTSKPSGISYKLSRPSLIKQSRPLRVTPVIGSAGDQEVNQGPATWRNSVEMPAAAETSPHEPPQAPETEGLSTEPLAHAEVSVMVETLEDMSLSSTSSMDRNDTSQEYMDDFDNLGNGGVGILLVSSKSEEDDSGLDQSCTRFDDDKVSVSGVTKTAGLCFVEDGMDWAAVRLGGERAAQRLTRLSHQGRSSQTDFHEQGGSSLDLSPSDSCGSGGTYMWDEEGLEPLGGAATSASINTNSNTTHHIGSFDSDLNSIDILNNLDSCDLEDDDLMLDADLAEDGSLHSDADGTSHMAQWRRRQLCWGMQDIHDDHDRSPCLSPAAPALGLDVEELAEDCSAVRSQLEFLQRLLLQEEDLDDDTLTTDTVSPDANESGSDSEVQLLLQEVQQLREELRSRDRTIAQLTLKLTVPTTTTRCCCQETTGRMDRYTQTSVTERENVASQTPWGDDTSQIPRSSGQEDQEPLMDHVPPRVLAAAPPSSTQPECPRTPPVTRGEERKSGPSHRSLPLPQPSRLHLFLSQSSRPARSSAAAPPPKARTPRLLSSDPASNNAAGIKFKSLGFASSFSRLPKPKSS